MCTQLSYADITVGLDVVDSTGYIGTVTECDDIHNIVVEYKKGGGGLYCLSEECDDAHVPDELYIPTILDRYNSELYGKHFTVGGSDIVRKFSRINSHNSAIITWDGDYALIRIINIFEYIDDGTWIISLIDLRKDKINKILSNGL